MTLQINLSGRCPADITNVDEMNNICYIAQGDSSAVDGIVGGDFQAPSDPVPTSITRISYYELSESLEVISQESVMVTGAGDDEVTFTSVAANLDPNEPLSDQDQFVVSSVVLVIEGKNAAGNLVTNTVSWKYDLQQCNSAPMAAFDTLGWVTVTGLKSAKAAFCPVVPPTMDPTTSPTAMFVKQEISATPSVSPTKKKPSLSGQSSGWAADGWNPPESHLLGGGNATTTTAATGSLFSTTTVVSDSSATESTAASPATTTVEATPPITTEATMTVAASTTTEATRAPKSQVALAQANYLDTIANAGSAVAPFNWFIRGGVSMVSIVIVAILLV
jgi:hypothetical protein